MDDLKCGDVCICDLSLSMNTHKHSVVPLVFISVSWKEETPIYALHVARCNHVFDIMSEGWRKRSNTLQ